MNLFFSMLEERWQQGGRVCVGLDSERAKLPPKYQTVSLSGQAAFNAEIVKATKDLVLCYKPNIKFYPGPQGLASLIQAVETIRAEAPGVPIILDAKYNDIGNTLKGSVVEAFDIIGADAVTVDPYLGQEALKPFLERNDKGIIVLCRTSNPGAGEFQDLRIWKQTGHGGYKTTPLYEVVAANVAEKWNVRNNCALVVGATAPEVLKRVRGIVGDMSILIPGVGTQGGDVAQAVLNGVNSKKSGIIINSSSGIIFNQDPSKALLKLTGEIDAALAQIP
ncbi:MAG: orotidine-5'-phosphate decarboxylase [bacterium]|nr:orotidine-5'-phosphate decarboxylase [bacterium]